MKLVNLNKSDGTKPGGYVDWKRKIIEVTQTQDSDTGGGQYVSFFISKFSAIPRGFRFTPERLSSMTVGEDLISQEKELFTEILYNKKVTSTWNFSKIRKIRPEIRPPQEIKTIPYTI